MIKLHEKYKAADIAWQGKCFNAKMQGIQGIQAERNGKYRMNNLKLTGEEKTRQVSVRQLQARASDQGPHRTSLA